MTTPRPHADKSFVRQVFITRDDLLAARWWHETMQAQVALSPNRRAALGILLGMGGVVTASLLLRTACNDFSGPTITMDALELQRKEGWAVGAQGQPLLIPDGVSADSSGSTAWSTQVASLSKDLAPANARFDPFYVSTLFEVLGNPRGAGLASILRPMHGVAMDVAEHAARALAALFTKDEDRKITALILDMPGPLSVAAAAGLARVFTPVFLFDNWPHPLGVVPSHETLAAAIYHRPDFVDARTDRQTTAPAPAFVLDSRRLSPYRDESDRFDNRYLARLPSADNLAGLGVERVLYVTAYPQAHELDDLNDDLVAFKNKTIDVKMIALSDFAPAPESLMGSDPSAALASTYYYGGHPMGHVIFWSSYHWSSPSYSGRPWTGGGLSRTVSGGHAFAPTLRPTMFSSRSVGGLSGVGKQRPSGFGRVSYRSGGGGFGRSGSFGRTSFGGSG